MSNSTTSSEIQRKENTPACWNWHFSSLFNLREGSLKKEPRKKKHSLSYTAVVQITMAVMSTQGLDMKGETFDEEKKKEKKNIRKNIQKISIDFWKKKFFFLNSILNHVISPSLLFCQFTVIMKIATTTTRIITIDKFNSNLDWSDHVFRINRSKKSLVF